MSAGQNLGLKLAGSYAADTLRLEKGIRQWGCDLDTETTPLDAGLSTTVDMTKVTLQYNSVTHIMQVMDTLIIYYCSRDPVYYDLNFDLQIII